MVINAMVNVKNFDLNDFIERKKKVPNRGSNLRSQGRC